MLKDLVTNNIVFSVPLIAILFSILLAIITIFLSSYFSARKAQKVTPIEAIRSNNDIKIKAKKVKSPKIIKKIFGVGGDVAYKNLKRNRSKYRTTVISLVVSITIFIALSTFINYGFDMTGLYYNDLNFNFDIALYINTESGERADRDEQIKIKNKILRDYSDNIKSYSEVRSFTDTSATSNLTDYLTEKGKDYYRESYIDDGDDFGDLLTIYAIGEKPYKDFVKKIGLKYEDVKDKIIFIDSGTFSYKKQQIKLLKMKEGDRLKKEKDGKEIFNMEIAKVTNELPTGFMEHSTFPYFIVSDEEYDKITDLDIYKEDIGIDNIQLEIYTENADELEKQLSQDEELRGININNIESMVSSQNRIVLWISVFLYGFIIVITLIGVTNIFNTITTNMNLRSKEFAMLKSIGMTKKEFNRMINLESIFYGIKSLIIGNILGIGLSYLIYKAIAEEMDFGFMLPYKSIIISIIFVMVIVGITMRYSLSKINKQNIIETIRKENI